MVLTGQDFSKIKKLIRTEINGSKKINGLKTDVAGLKTDVAGLKTDVAGLKTDVAGLKTDVAWLKNEVYDLKDDVSEIKESIKHLPTKDELATQGSEIMGELKAIREEITIMSGRQSDHSDRIEKLEDIHPKYRHQSTL